MLQTTTTSKSLLLILSFLSSLCCLTFYFFSTTLFSQNQAGKALYPQGYFQNPLSIPMDLSGNFGELRPNHYHMGLDIKTQKRENLPVYAAADGYIARIKIEPFGFGRAIYINHPNGYTTLYAHLNNFFPALEAYVKEQQYLQQSWTLLLDVPADRFPIKKADFLAYSGNTGGSQAPHLHWEIRETSTDVNLNPLLFGLPLKDATNPTIAKLALYDLSKSVYEQTPTYIAVVKTKNGYTTHPAIITTQASKVGFAIAAVDTHNGSTNPNSIFDASLYDNNNRVVDFQMNNISYLNTRGLNAHIDYKTKYTRGPYLQQLFQLPGYLHSIYIPGTSNGLIELEENITHAITIVVKDAQSNTTQLNSGIRYVGANKSPAEAWPGKQFYPLHLDGFETADCEFFITEHALYDSVHIHHQTLPSYENNIASAIHSIGTTYIPLNDSILVRLKPAINLSIDQKNKVIMQRLGADKKDKDVAKVWWQNSWAAARFKSFGLFQLLIDETPPTILPVGIIEGATLSAPSSIAFAITDNYETIRNFKATLDGQWLLFSNDKGKVFKYQLDEKCPPGTHELQVTVQDEAGNTTTQAYHFTSF
jgi:murein DD-endopeptidase MepM/ murein hydrolase activator NlpD